MREVVGKTAAGADPHHRPRPGADADRRPDAEDPRQLGRRRQRRRSADPLGEPAAGGRRRLPRRAERRAGRRLRRQRGQRLPQPGGQRGQGRRRQDHPVGPGLPRAGRCARPHRRRGALQLDLRRVPPRARPYPRAALSGDHGAGAGQLQQGDRRRQGRDRPDHPAAGRLPAAQPARAAAAAADAGAAAGAASPAAEPANDPPVRSSSGAHRLSSSAGRAGQHPLRRRPARSRPSSCASASRCG